VPDYQLLIFDWDGTLVDSIGRIVEAMHRAADVGQLRRCSDAEVRGIIGLERGMPSRPFTRNSTSPAESKPSVVPTASSTCCWSVSRHRFSRG